MTMKKIAILGSTGSIGTSALHVIRHLKEELKVVALSGNENIDVLEAQALEFHPELIAVSHPQKALELQKRLPQFRVVAGREGLEEVASLPNADVVLSALNGAAGIAPTVAAIKARKLVALANKEVLVAAGDYVMGLVKEYGTTLLPVDSEHSALFQVLRKENPAQLRRLILTASGGPFLHTPAEALVTIDVAAALKHNYQMGKNITINCSTLMNKGLEAIEAHYLFDVPVSQIEIVIHRQSIIHSLIEMCDGSILAQMSDPNMTLPIQYALTFPERKAAPMPYFDFTKARTLDFAPLNPSQFPCVALAYEAMRQKGTSLPYLNAANEVLVSRFLQQEISWLDISQKLETLFVRHSSQKINDLDTIFAADALAREEALTI